MKIAPQQVWYLNVKLSLFPFWIHLTSFLEGTIGYTYSQKKVLIDSNRHFAHQIQGIYTSRRKCWNQTSEGFFSEKANNGDFVWLQIRMCTVPATNYELVLQPCSIRYTLMTAGNHTQFFIVDIFYQNIFWLVF